MRDLVLYLGGGVMSGIFGAGFVRETEGNVAFDKMLEDVLTGSAGGINWAYRETGQSELGSTIYFEDLTHGFYNPWKVATGTAQRAWNKFFDGKIPIEKMHNPIDIDLLFDVMTQKKKLDLDRLTEEKPYGFKVKVFNPKKEVMEYLDVRKDPLKALKAGVSAVPYYFPEKSQEYIDGDIIEPVGLEHLLKEYPGRKYIIVLNHFPSRNVLHRAGSVVEGAVASLMYPNISKYYRARAKKFLEDVESAQSYRDAILIHPPAESRTIANTIDRQKLIETYEMGREEARKLLKIFL